MPTRAKGPRYWVSRDAYYVTVNGVQHCLAKGKGNEKAAWRAFFRLMADLTGGDKATEQMVHSAGGEITLAVIWDEFQDHLRRERAVYTNEWYRRHLESFIGFIGGPFPAMDTKPFHVTRWLNDHSWGPTTRHGAITAVKRLFSWSKKQGYLPANPLADMEKPTPKRRQAILTAEQFNAILAATKDRPFRDLLIALRYTGCRPGEVYSLTANRANVKAGTWTVINKTRHKTGEDFRTIYLTPNIVELTQRLLNEHPKGPIFRNRLGNPWTRNAVACRFGEIRRTMPDLNIEAEGCAYSLRHLYITDALERGIPPATVAELVGHQGLTMIMKIYNKLSNRVQHLKEAALKVISPIPGLPK